MRKSPAAAISRPGSSLKRSLALLALAGATALAVGVETAAAGRSDLVSFLERAEKMFAHNRLVRADITIKQGDGSSDAAVLIIDPENNRQFFALKSSGWRALSPLDWGAGSAVAKPGAKPATHGADDRLASTDLRPLEFFPFWKADYTKAFISDDNRLEKTVTLYVDDVTPYTLFVVTVDKTQLVPVLTKYYKDTMRNLVRLRRDYDHVMVGSRPRPQRIVINDYTENRETTFELAWRTLESVPEGLLSASAFHKSAINWHHDSPVVR